MKRQKLMPTNTHYECYARCMTCGNTWGASTAHGTAYQHAAIHGHCVIIDAHHHVVYNGSEPEKTPNLFTETHK